MPSDPNLLGNNGNQRISGRTLLLFAAVVGAGIVALVPVLPTEAPLATVGALYGLLLLATIVAVLPLGPAALPALAVRPVGWKPLVLGPLATIALSVLVTQIGPEVESMKNVAEMVSAPDTLLVSLLLLGGLAPVVEELIFRGLLYGWIERRWGVRAAVAVSALAFAAAHFDPTYMLLVLPLGFLFSWLRWRTASLWPSIVSHMVNNSFAVLSAAATASN